MGKVCSAHGVAFDTSITVRLCQGIPLDVPDRGSNQLVGEVVDDRFRLDAVLGEGGMGKVYEATQLSVDRRVAVKMIRTSGLQSQEVTQRFMREARVISGFSHPNIVRLIDFGEDDHLGLPYLAMEYLDGLELTELLDDSRLHPNFALEVASQIGAALVEAHDAGIVHRDLKTDNVLLMPVSSGACQVKVIDFGIAFPKETSENLTQTGMICGTPHYLSPEQARGSDVDLRADLYSLGVILFEMTTGALPFQADSPFNIMVKHVQEEPPPLTDYLDADDVPAEFHRLVRDLMEKEPDDRPESGREIRRRIDAIRDETDWESIRLQGTEPLREELAPWLLPKVDRSSSSIAFDETLGTDQGLGPTGPEPDDEATSETAEGLNPAAPPTGDTAASDRSTSSADDSSGSVANAVARADRADSDSNPVRARDPDHGRLGRRASSRDGATADLAQADDDRDYVRLLAIAATSLFLLVSGLALAAVMLTGESESRPASGAVADDDSAPAPTPTAGESSPAGGETAAPEPTVEETDLDVAATSDDDETETLEFEAAGPNSDEPEIAGAEATGDDLETDDSASPSGGDDPGASESSDPEPGSKPDEAPDPEPSGSGGPDPSGGTSSGSSDDGRPSAGSDSRPVEPKAFDEEPSRPDPDPPPSSGSDSSDDVDEEYEGAVEWLTDE